MKTSLTYDMGYLEAGLGEIEAYLLGKELFWPLKTPSPAGEPAFGQLTLGGLLLAIERIRPRAVSAQSRAQAESLTARLDAMRTKWRVAWEEKATWELSSRLRQWGHYITELQRDPQEYGVYYDHEVRLRVWIELLLKESKQPAPADSQKLILLDSILSGWLIGGEFLWDEDLKLGFPQATYWYLWGKISR